MCLVAWMSARAHHALARKTMFTAKSDGRQFHLFGKLENLVCVSKSTGSDWLAGWLAAGLSVGFLAFDMSETSVFRLTSLFNSFYKNPRTRARCCCCFGSLLFFIFPSRFKLQKSFNILACTKDRMDGNSNEEKENTHTETVGGFHATIKISSNSENARNERALK